MASKKFPSLRALFVAVVDGHATSAFQRGGDVLYLGDTSAIEQQRGGRQCLLGRWVGLSR